MESGGNAGSIETFLNLNLNEMIIGWNLAETPARLKHQVTSFLINLELGWNLAETPARLKLFRMYILNLNKGTKLESGGNAGSIETLFESSLAFIFFYVGIWRKRRLD